MTVHKSLSHLVELLLVEVAGLSYWLLQVIVSRNYGFVVGVTILNIHMVARFLRPLPTGPWTSRCRHLWLCLRSAEEVSQVLVLLSGPAFLA